MALLNPRKDPSVAKSFRPISLLCHTNKLFERLILNRIPEQAGFRPEKSCTSQLLNLTEHIEDGYEKRLITGAVFVDLSAAYDTVNQTTPPLQGARDDWRRTPERPDTHHAGKQTLLRGAEREEEALATTTKRTTTGKCTGTDVVQHLHQRPARTHRHAQLHLRRRLVHRDARKQLQQYRSVTHVCPEHYDHLLRHGPTACEPFKDTGVCFPPKEPRSQTRTECSVERYQTLKHNNTSCNVTLYTMRVVYSWDTISGSKINLILSYRILPVYLGIHLDRTMCYKMHIEKRKMKVNAINNIIRKLANSKWGCKASTLRPSCLAFCYSELCRIRLPCVGKVYTRA